jgi:hypothetical protein
MSDPLLDAADTVKQALANRIIQDPKRELQAFLKEGYLNRDGSRGYLAKEILLLIAALCKGGPLSIMSLLRPGKGPHGVPFGGEYLCQAIDIAAYRRKLIKLQTNRAFDAYLDPNAPTNTHDGVTGVLSQLPKLPGGLLFGVGMPRTTSNPGGPDVPEALRLYLPRPAGGVRGIAKIKLTFSYKDVTIATVRQDIAKAIATSPAGKTAWVNGDGMDHIHLQVERKNKPDQVYRDAAWRPA